MSGRRLMLLAVSLGALVIGARWACIDRFGMAMPYMDQWDAEARRTIIPWYAGNHSLSLFWQPHNEHRIVFTRVAALVLTELNGEWDQRFEAVANAFLGAGLALGWLWLARRALPRRAELAGMLLLIAVLYATPLSWENIVHGFHSQQFFLIAASLGAIAGFSFGAARGSVAGVLLAAAALGTMASGGIAALICLPVLGLRWRRGEMTRSRAALLAGALVAIFITAIATQVSVAGHAPLRSHTALELIHSAVRYLAWPDADSSSLAAALVLWFPFFGLAIARLRVWRETPTVDWFVFGAGLWTLLQIAAMAFARSAAIEGPATRYFDTLIVGILVNAFALARQWLPDGASNKGRWVALVWIAALCWGLSSKEISTWRFLNGRDYQDDLKYEEINVRHFVADGRMQDLQHAEIPYPAAEPLAAILQSPVLRPLLPATVRAPLAARTASSGRPDSTLPFGFPQTDRIAFHVIRGTGPAPTTWRSAPLHSSIRGRLQFLVAGDLGRPGTVLMLVGGGEKTAVAAVSRQDQRWHAVSVPCPPGEFFIEGHASGPDWFAFTDPVEITEGSYLAARLVRAGKWIAVVGLIGILWTLLQRQRPQRRSPTAGGIGGNTD